ncbi:MAG: hypothetical protein KDD61_17400 [Bdellovibrionales bacterium]|nr:hypothetical protein [Bdellovibrionales bacterium]
MKRNVYLIVSLLNTVLLLLSGCRLNTDILGISGNQSTSPLIINNSFTSLKMGSSIDLNISGGLPPYNYQVLSGAATIDLNGRLQVGWSHSDLEVKVTDSIGEEFYVTVPVEGGSIHLTPLNPSGLQNYSLPIICSNTKKIYFMGELETVGVVELFESDFNGDNLRKINSPLVTGGNVYNAQLTPDCQGLFYIADQVIDNVNDVFSVDLNGGSPINLTNLTSGTLNFMDYSPTLNKMAVVGNNDGTFKSELFTVTFGVTSSLSIVSDTLAADFPGITEARFLADDTTIMFSGTQFSASEKHVHTQSLTAPAGISQISNNGTGAWTFLMPQEIGSSGNIVYGSLPSGSCKLYGGLAETAGSVNLLSTNINFESTFCNDFVGLSDGSQVFYPASNSSASTKAIYMSSTSAQGSTMITPSYPSASTLFSKLKLSSDESTIYFTARLPSVTGIQLYKVDIATGVVTVLSLVEDVRPDFQLSPDESKIIFKSNAPSTYDLYVTNTDGTGTPLKLSPTNDVTNFSVLTSKVIFMMKANPGDPYELYSIDFDGNNMKKISRTVVAGGNVLTFSVSQDEQSIFYGGDLEVDGRYEIYFTSAE